MRVTVLGCGTSSGVPVIGCRCRVCTSDDPRDRRRRCAILIEQGATRILVDTPPDLRCQCLDAGIDRLDAILVFTLAERFKHTQSVGVLKARHGLPPSDPPRESVQIARLERLAEEADLEATLNCGVGMVSLTAPESVDTAIALLGGHGIRAWVAGEVRLDSEDGGRVRLEGQHPGW